jgi:hypothetical protein
MSTIDWPTSITPAAVQWQIQKAGVQFASPFNGTTQAVDYMAERWAVSLSLPNQRSPGALAALMNSLAGGVNRVNLWHHGSGGQPAGTLRGTPVLGSGAARGDATLTLAACTGVNLILSGGFEIDTNADGLADNWAVSTAGTTGSIGYGLVDGTSGKFQSIAAAGLGPTSGDQVQVGSTVYAGVSAGQTYTYGIDVWGSGGAALKIWIEWRTSANAFISTSESSGLSLPTGRTRYTISAQAPSTAARAYLKLRIDTRSGGPSACTLNIDSAQIEAGAMAGSFTATTLLAGDMIGCSGHLFQVASDCTATDAGVMTVPVVNRARATIASSTAVTWYRPTAQFILPAMAAGAMQVPGYTQGPALDLLEVY